MFIRTIVDCENQPQLPLAVPNFAREIIFEFTEQDQVIKNEKGYWIPKPL